MEFDFFGYEKSWNLKCQKEYEPCVKRSGEVVDRTGYCTT